MSNRRHGAGYRVHTWWPVAFALALIALESTELFSSLSTGGPLRHLWQRIFGEVSDLRWAVLHYQIRKSGHFIGFGLLGLVWLRAWWRTLPHSRFLTDAALALLATATVASADEWHQSMLPNRTSSVWDVLLDCCGSLAIQLVVYLWWRIRTPKRLLHEE